MLISEVMGCSHLRKGYTDTGIFRDKIALRRRTNKVCVYIKTEIPQGVWKSLGLGRDGVEPDRNGSEASDDRRRGWEGGGSGVRWGRGVGG